MRFIFSIGFFLYHFLTVDIKSSCCITDSDVLMSLSVCHSMYWNLGDCRITHTYFTNSSSPALYSRNSCSRYRNLDQLSLHGDLVGTTSGSV